MPRKISEVRLYQRAQKYISNKDDDSTAKSSVSRFYDWLKRGLSKRNIQRNQQTILVKIAHQETKECYGHIRLTRYLQSQGIQISEYAVRCIKKLGA